LAWISGVGLCQYARMPIYEFYCPPCHTLYSFLARRVGVSALPVCPLCRGALSRQVSPFAHLRQRAGGDAGDGEAEIDESRVQQVMAGMAGELEQLDDENADPRAVAGLMRKFAGASGMAFNPFVEEALTRMERGEDPDALEAEYGDALGAENPFAAGEPGGRLRGWARRLGAGPRRDPKLYDL
jgi:putative FmdB family regulatory protein